MGAIKHLPETLIALPETKHIRQVFIRSDYAHIWDPDDFDIELQPGERIVNIEWVQPNPSIGSGIRVWIECT